MLAIANACVKVFDVGNFVLESDITYPDQRCVIDGRTDKNARFQCTIGPLDGLFVPHSNIIGRVAGKGLRVKFEYPNEIRHILVIIDEETGIHILTNPRLCKLFAAVLELN